jgi:cytochrome P450
MTASVPTSAIDIYTDDVISNPYAAYREMRDLGPAVWMERHGVWAITRFQQVFDALHNYEVFSSADGVALTPETNQAIKGNTLASDPPAHDEMRGLTAPSLSPRALRLHREEVERRADLLVDELLSRRTIDAVRDFAEVFPLSLVPDLVGIPEEGREHLLEWASGAFNTIGPANERTLAAVSVIPQMGLYAADLVATGNLREGSWGARLLAAAREKNLDGELISRIMFDYLAPSIDTTISALASSLLLLGANPHQWDMIRSNPKLIPNAFNEVVRFESPIRGFYRHVTKDVEMEGTTVPAGSWALMLYASANRDERKWDRPEAFDITRTASEHVGFGHGIHSCVGQGLARLEGHSLLSALAARVRRFEVGEPVWRLNNTIRCLDRLKVTLLPA